MLTEDQVNYIIEPQPLQDKIKLLIVEDDATARMLYDKGLFNPVFDKKMVISGQEAIHIYDEWHPDIIVLDIYLPEMTGYQVLKEIRTTFKDRKTTIVMATSLSGSEDVQSCIKLGIEGYIIKPFQCDNIGGKILDYYEKKEPERVRKAATLHQEILRKSYILRLLEQNESRTQKTMGVLNDDVSHTKTGEVMGENDATEKKVAKGE